MIKEGLAVLMGCLTTPTLIAATLSVLVSFSMPTNLLEETLKESSRLGIPVYLNGLYHDSIEDSALKIMALSKHVPNLNLQIDPTIFERFGITEVPALIADNGATFDVIYGHLPIKEGLARMAGRGDSGLSVLEVRRITGD